MTAPPLRLLLSARDMGAGGGIAEIAAAARADPRFAVRCTLQAPAAQRLGLVGDWVERVEAPTVTGLSDPGLAQLVAAADDVLARARPDALVVGLSGPEAGLDEALLLRASPGVSRFAVQDFWGDVNLRLGAPADGYLVIDELAADLTRARCGKAAVVVGSIKHARYRSLDPDALRIESRAWLGARDADRVVAFFGQPLWDWPGYASIVQHLAASVRALPFSTTTVFRPHPKDGPEAVRTVIEMFRDLDLDLTIDEEERAELLLAAADVVTSAFSTSGIDQLFLNRCARSPLGVVVFVLSDPRIRALYKETTGLTSLPPVDRGLAMQAHDERAIAGLLASALTPEARLGHWRRIQAQMQAPELAPKRALEAIWAGGGEPGEQALRALLRSNN